MTIKKSLLAACLGLLFAGLSPVQAAMQSYTFSGTLDSGFYVDETYSGSFSFDDAGLTGSGAEWLNVSSLSLNLLGNTYTQADADTAVEVGYNDGAFLGLSYSVSSGEPQFSFVPGSVDSSDAFIAYDTAMGLSGAGTAIYAPVPEPESWAMLMLGLGLVSLRLRSKSKSLSRNPIEG